MTGSANSRKGNGLEEVKGGTGPGPGGQLLGIVLCSVE